MCILCVRVKLNKRWFETLFVFGLYFMSAVIVNTNIRARARYLTKGVQRQYVVCFDIVTPFLLHRHCFLFVCVFVCLFVCLF